MEIDDLFYGFQWGSATARKTMNTQTIVHKAAGHIVPAAFFETLFSKQKPTAMGFSIQDASDDSLVVHRTNEVLTLEQLNELCEKAKDFNAILTFSTFTETVGEEDIQPFVISDPNETPCFAIHMEGDFSKFCDPASGHSEEYNFATKIIIPTITEMVDDFGGDLDKVMSKLNGELFNTSFLSHVGHRGVINILPIIGDPVLLAKNELGETYEWGTVSQRHTFGDAKQEPAPVEQPKANKVLKWFSGKQPEVVKEVASDPKGQATKGDAPRTSVPAVAANSEQKYPAKPASTAKGTVQAVKPPDWAKRNQDIKNFYIAVHGSVPQNWKKKIPVTVSNPEVLQFKSNDQVTHYLMQKNVPAAEASAPAPAVGDNKAAAAAVDNLNKHIEVVETLPVLSAKTANEVIDFVAKHLDTNSQEIADPKTMQQREAELKIPTFTEALGLGEYDTINWSPSGIFALFKKYPDAGALFAIEMRNKWRATVDMKDLVATAPKKETVVVNTKTDLGNGSTKTESVVVDKPAKSGWSFGKKKVA